MEKQPNIKNTTVSQKERQKSTSSTKRSKSPLIRIKRVPNCQKCGQHGVKARLKGHKQECQFRDCECPKCSVISERQKLMAKQIKIRRRQRKEFTAGREQRTQLLMLESEFEQQQQREQQQGQQPPANAPEIVSSSDAGNANAISPPLQQPMATNSELGSSAADAGATLAYASLASKLEEICCQLLLGQRQPQDQKHFPAIMPQPLLPGILSVAEQIAAAKLLPLAKPMPMEFCLPSNSSSTSTPSPQPSAQLFQFQQHLAALLAISNNHGGLPVLANAGFHLPSQTPRVDPIIRLQQNVNVSHV